MSVLMRSWLMVGIDFQTNSLKRMTASVDLEGTAN